MYVKRAYVSKTLWLWKNSVTHLRVHVVIVWRFFHGIKHWFVKLLGRIWPKQSCTYYYQSITACMIAGLIMILCQFYFGFFIYWVIFYVCLLISLLISSVIPMLIYLFVRECPLICVLSKFGCCNLRSLCGAVAWFVGFALERNLF